MKARLIFLLSLPFLMNAHASDFAALEKVLDSAVRGGRYEPAPASELEAAERLFLRLAQGATEAEVTSDAGALALDVETHGDLVIVRERADARRGRGLFAFRRNARPDVLHVPHGFSDRMTREIGVGLFSEGSFSAAVWNTVRRSPTSDMAHMENTWFNAFVRATARAWPNGTSLQIHGFEQSKRRSGRSAAAQAIVSNGTQTPGASLERQTACLNRAFGGTFVLYPFSSQELGGTRNAQGALLRVLGYRHFIHIEFSHPLREALMLDAGRRGLLLACLQP